MPLADPNAPLPRRILFHGVTGTGKSSAAARLSALSGIPWHSADDDIGWLPAEEARWTNRPPEEMLWIAKDICAQDEWILDSAYSLFIEPVMERVELVIALDYPRHISFLRLLRRTAQRVRDRRPVCNGNIETLRQTFSKDSILLWHLRTFTRKKSQARSWAADPDGPQVLAFSRPEELDQWLTRATRTNPEESQRP
ncbi:adenylate kinase [Arthrobacter sp. NPDC090010]|uniref:adenylate kinase n=1 Tax=Arthrobacter sp. NPDC090010 TaxID=3363942 RepID=UPI00380628BA